MIVLWSLIWLLAGTADFLFTLLTLFLAPLLAIFTGSDGNLPKYLTWFQTFDATLDAGWQGNYFTNTAPPWWVPVWTVYSGTGTPTGLNLYWLRVRWLWRNPGYGFSYYAVGIAFDPTAWRVVHYSASSTSTTFIATNGRQFNIELGWSWLQVKIGWKAWNYFNAATGTFKTTPWGPAMRTMICATLIPW